MQRLRQEQARPILEKLQRVSAGAACDGIAEEPARHSHRLRAAQLGRPGALAQDGQQRGGASAAAHRSGPEELSVCGQRSGAHRTAILCSLVQTCKHLQINSFVYLRDVIDRVSTHPERLVLELAPREWKRFRQDSVAQAAA